MPDYSDFIGIEITGLEELKAKLSRLPGAAQDEGIEAASKYLINVLRHYPSEKRVTRKAAFGRTFFTEKQRRWFFAALHSGALVLPYRRTQTLAQSWDVLGYGRNSIIVNKAKYADIVIGEEQNRLSKMIGWKKPKDTIKERMTNLLREVDGAVKKAIRRLGL